MDAKKKSKAVIRIGIGLALALVFFSLAIATQSGTVAGFGGASLLWVLFEAMSFVPSDEEQMIEEMHKIDRMEKERAITTPKKCPACQSIKVQRMEYGTPVDPGSNPDVYDAGCVQEDNSPAWNCADCSHEWGIVKP